MSAAPIAAASRLRAGASAGFRYVASAIVSTLANIGSQAASDLAGAPVTVSVGIGTVVGFAVKYLLDKLWIFEDRYAGRASEIRKILLYGAFSVVTTLVFWGFEFGFWRLWGTDAARYGGAVLGLAIGYAAKYTLDRTYTFTERAK